MGFRERHKDKDTEGVRSTYNREKRQGVLDGSHYERGHSFIRASTLNL